jgi:hypothetical protein
MAKIKSGGGITSNKFVQPNIRTGSPNKGSSPGSADQIGQSVAFKREEVERGRAYPGTKLGNEVALNIGKGGPGAGRTTHPCGSQGRHGPPVAGEPRQGSTADVGPRSILNEKGS